MTKKTVVFHLGYHKTGSTSIQFWLHDNARTLEPYLDCYNLVDGGAHALKLAAVRLAHGLSDDTDLVRECCALADAIRRSPKRSVCVTDESLLGMPLGFTRGSFVETAIYPGARRVADVLAREFAEFRPTFIVLERKPMEWLKSVHSQMVKQDCFSGDFDAYLARFAPSVDWMALRGEIAAGIAGRGRLLPLDFHDEFARKTVAEMAFFKALGLPPEAFAAAMPRLPWRNRSPDRGAAAPPADPWMAGNSTPRDREAAFRVFLGRTPRMPGHDPQQSRHMLNRAMADSAEFRSSARAVKSDLGWPASQVFVSVPARLLFCPIARNACTALKVAMARTTRVPELDYIAPDIHFIADTVRTGLQLADHDPEQARRMLRSASFLRFAVLRDPAQRLVSVYLDLFVANRMQPWARQMTGGTVQAVHAARGIDTDHDRGITFRELVAALAAGDPATFNPRWRPQAAYLEGIACDRLFRLDQLGAVFDLIESRAGKSLPRPSAPAPRPVETDRPGAADLLPSEIADGPRPSVMSFLDRTTEAALRDIYAADHALLDRV